MNKEKQDKFVAWLDSEIAASQKALDGCGGEITGLKETLAGKSGRSLL